MRIRKEKPFRGENGLIKSEILTRAKKKLKIYWSAETMKEIVSGFATNESNGKSLEIVKAKLAVTQ